MPGLLPQEASEQTPGPAAVPGPQGVAPEAGYTGEEGQPNVSPEEQAQYDKFVDNGLKLIYSEGMMEKIQERMGAGGNPIEGLANVTFMVVNRLVASAEKAGQKISGDVLLHGGVEILEDLANLAQESGIHEFTDDEMESALYATMDLHGEHKTKSGTLDKEAHMNDFAALIEADKSGALEGEFPGLKDKFAGARGEAAPVQAEGEQVNG